jgi:VanZ family protein
VIASSENLEPEVSVDRSEDPSGPTKLDRKDRARPSRFWRYAPLVAWMLLISFASTGEFSAANTSRFIRPLLRWLIPEITEAQLRLTHFYIRKSAHFLEYAVFAFLAARAFATSSREVLRRNYFAIALSLVVIYALVDEGIQTLNASRTGSIYDSVIDTAGGLTALVLYVVWRRKKGGAALSRTLPNIANKLGSP